MSLNCLRGFPHVIKAIKELWGGPELELYINKLVLMDKPRDGFPPDAFVELNEILDVHRLLFAKCDKPACCVEKRLDRGPYRW